MSNWAVTLGPDFVGKWRSKVVCGGGRCLVSFYYHCPSVSARNTYYTKMRILDRTITHMLFILVQVNVTEKHQKCLVIEGQRSPHDLEILAKNSYC